MRKICGAVEASWAGSVRSNGVGATLLGLKYDVIRALKPNSMPVFGVELPEISE